MILTDKQTNQKADLRVGGAKPTETGASDETTRNDGHEHTSDQAVMIRHGMTRCTSAGHNNCQKHRR